MVPVSTLSFLLGLLLATPAVAVPAPAPAPAPASELEARRGGSDRSRLANILGVPINNTQSNRLVANAYIAVYNKNCTDDDITSHQQEVQAMVAKTNLRRRELSNSSDPVVETTVNAMKINNWHAMCLGQADDQTILSVYNSSMVNYIEQDARVSTFELTEQTGAASGLARLSGNSSADTASKDYTFDTSAGQGITVFVLDTGIRTTHSEFEGRATFGANFADNTNTDGHGHGSHVAGTIGGRTFGVAKKVNLVAVKVLDTNGQGTNSGIIQGMQFVAQNVTAAGTAGKTVVNMSVGGSRSRALNDAINALRNAGVIPVVAAGNDNADATNTSPASATAAITVGAIDQTTDTKASFSNFGSFVDIFAPGVNVKSVGIKSDTDTNVLSGTSMASPHVAGLSAYLMVRDSLTSADAVLSRIQQLATASGASVKNNAGSTTNLIATNGE